MSQRFEGKNVDEALGQAADAFGVERYRLTYHVVLEKRGFLGGVKRVVIEAEVNDAVAEAPAAVAAQPAAPAVARGGEIGGRPRRDRGPRGGGGGGGRSRDDRGGGGREGGRGRRGRRDRGGFENDRHEAFDPPPAPAQGPESDGANGVRVWVEDVLEHGRFDIEVRTEENDTQIIVKLYGRDTPRFVDRDGELLDAIQVLANKALVGRKLEKDIELDCQQFKERRVEELGQKAREVADRVRKDGREQLLPAMSPIERRIIHLALQDDAEVMTESHGDGFYKRVAIKLRPAGAQPQETPPES